MVFIRYKSGTAFLSTCLLIGLSFVLAGCGGSATSYFERGKTFAQNGQHDDAILNFRNAIKNNPRFGEAYLHLGRSLIERDRYQEAYEALQQSVALMPSSVEARVALAGLVFVSYVTDPSRPRGLYDQAARLADEILDRGGKFDGARMKGQLALVIGREQEARQFFEEANRLRAGNHEVVVALTQLRFRLGSVAEAESLARNAIHADKSLGAIYDVLYRHYLSAGRTEDAAAVVRLKSANNPDNVEFALQVCEHQSVYQRTAVRDCTAAIAANSKQYRDTYSHLGQYFQKRGDWDQAIRYFRRGESEAPSAAVAREFRHRLMDAFITSGRHPEALKVIDEILAEDKVDQSARISKARILLARRDSGSTAEALKDLRELAQHYPNSPEVHVLLAAALKAVGETSAALVEYQEALRRDPSNAEAIKGATEISLAQKRYSAALEYAAQLQAVAPADRQAQLLRSAILMAQGLHKQAEQELRSVLRDSPAHPEANLQLAFVRLSAGDLAGAEALLRKIYRPGLSDTRAVAGLAEVEMARGNADKGLAILQAEVAKSADAVAVRKALADLAARAGKYDIAIEQYRAMIAAGGSTPELHVRIGDTCQLKGDMPCALAEYQKALSLTPKGAAPHAALAFVQSMAGKTSEARESLRKAAAQNPDDATVLNNLAFLEAESGGDLDQALRMALRAQARMPGNDFIADTVGWIYLKKGDAAAALQIFRNLARKRPNDGVYRYHLGMALLKSGDKRQSREELTIALQRGLTPAERAGAEQALRSLGTGL